MLQITLFDTKIEYFCRKQISLSGTPISLPKIADLPIWAQENITCMMSISAGSESEILIKI